MKTLKLTILALTFAATNAFAFSMDGNWSEATVTTTTYTSSGNNNKGGMNQLTNRGNNTLSLTTQQARGDTLTVNQGGTGNSYIVNHAITSGNSVIHQRAQFENVNVQATGNDNEFYLNKLEIQ